MATVGIRPLTDAELAERGPGPLRASAYHAADVLRWLGARATILPGVTVGEGTIIGAGAVVNKDCEPGAVYAGVPARRVR